MGGFRFIFAFVIVTLLVVSFTSANTQENVIDAKESVADIFANNPNTVLVAVSGEDVELNCARDASSDSFTC